MLLNLWPDFLKIWLGLLAKFPEDVAEPLAESTKDLTKPMARIAGTNSSHLLAAHRPAEIN